MNFQVINPETPTEVFDMVSEMESNGEDVYVNYHETFNWVTSFEVGGTTYEVADWILQDWQEDYDLSGFVVEEASGLWNE